MKANNIDVDCFFYIGADHTFSKNFLTDFRTTMLAFFDTKLKGLLPSTSGINTP
jgi:dipeptidyl aminopeptidase/acylaminoacyl peptidase